MYLSKASCADQFTELEAVWCVGFDHKSEDETRRRTNRGPSRGNAKGASPSTIVRWHTSVGLA